MNLNMSEYCQYLKALTQLSELHKELFKEDKNVVTPGLISESIVKYLLELDASNDGEKRFDAMKITDGLPVYYEIKATSSAAGTTTINISSRPDVLVWVYFDYEKQEIVLSELSNFNSIDSIETLFNEEALTRIRKDIFKKDNVVEKNRVSITLKNVNWDSTKKYNMDDLKEIN
ncbi:hypothetical protein [Liberiplasma polymorphum]|uniref:hypothetical protein n=1 Tax=Liberiplasma polymorphum TaxID=3374570 RepID=UPI0037767FD5